MGPREETVGAILAGGLARRMGGGDKPLLPLGGRPLIAHVAERLAPQCAAVVLNANGDPERFAGFALPVAADTVPNRPGPLAGILAALDWTAAHHPAARFVATVPGDTPFPPPDFVARLHAAAGQAGAPVAVAASGGREHFTAALWSVALRDDLRRALTEDGLRRVGGFLARHPHAVADWGSEPVDPFFNINEPADLTEAERRLHRGGMSAR